MVAAMGQGTEGRGEVVRSMDWVRSKEMRGGSWTHQMEGGWEGQRPESEANIQVVKEAAADLRRTSQTHC